MMSKHKRIKEQIFEQEDQFYLEDGDINVRLAIPAGSYYDQYVKVIGLIPFNIILYIL